LFFAFSFYNKFPLLSLIAGTIEKAHHIDGLYVKTKAHRHDGLNSQHPIIQALAPYLSGRLLCGHGACLSRTLYGQLGFHFWITIKFFH
jgi:hypothetical protein